MVQARPARFGAGWYFPAKVTALFLVVTTMAMTLLAYVGVDYFRAGNSGHVNARIDRAARTATALFQTLDDEFEVTGTVDGTPLSLSVGSGSDLSPSPAWDEFVDTVSETNEGAANVFRFDDVSGAFDRIATSFTTPEGDRVGGSQVEPGLIQAGHPAWESLVHGRPYQGEVPVAGRLRFAYLTPILDSSDQVVGAVAVDVGWVEDLNQLNDEVSKATWAITFALIASTAIAGIVVMLITFRPLHELIRVAEKLAGGDVPDEVPMTDRRGEIGVLANALARSSELQADLRDRATTDELTGLANRSQFMDELSTRIENAYLSGESLALLLIDLDQFKEVNDGLGHAAGDELLVALATSLSDILLPGEFLARLGGDEFALLSGPIDAEVDADEIAQRVSEAVNTMARTSVADIGLTCSAGIAILPEQADTAELALSHADLALYRAKRAGRAHWQFYQSSLEAPLQRRIHLATELRRAIHDGDIELEYQPIFDRGGNRMLGIESLARWNHPREGPIPPDEFITAAENAGLIDDLGNHVLERACAFAADLRRRELLAPTISINVSTIQLWQHDFFDRIVEALGRNGLPWNSICLEMTESVVVNHADSNSRRLLQELVDFGVRLAIDDFGTGYSALSYLRDLDVHQLKIDQAFTHGAVGSAAGRRLFQGIVSLGQSLGLQVVAEGIETERELGIARDSGCDAVQGFLLSRPLSGEEIRAMLTPRSAEPLPLRRRPLPRRQAAGTSLG